MKERSQMEGGGRQGQDPSILREQAYADDTHLNIRYRTHQLYTLDPVDFGKWTLEQLPWRGDERVLDVGCGPGDLICEMARLGVHAHQHAGWDLLVGFDFSAGMAAKATSRALSLPVHYFVGDAQAIPFPDNSFDVVMARHMLYHVPDIDRAIAEAARIVRPGGHFLATTNSDHSMPEYHALRRRAAARFPVMAESESVTSRFSLETGSAFFNPHFEQVEIHSLPGTLRFPSAQPFVDYFASSRALTMRPGHTETEWQAVVASVRFEAEETIRREGQLDISKITGAIVGVKGD